MLSHILALVVGFGSFALYISAFFFPEVYRKNDFIWSGIAMFYALVLWVCAGRITGGVLLGQSASVALVGWLGWQTLKLRRDLTPVDQQTRLPDSMRNLNDFAKTLGQQLSTQLQTQVNRLPLPAAVKRLPTQAADALTQPKPQPGKPRKAPAKKRPPVTVTKKTTKPPVKKASTPETVTAAVEERVENLAETVVETLQSVPETPVPVMDVPVADLPGVDAEETPVTDLPGVDAEETSTPKPTVSKTPKKRQSKPANKLQGLFDNVKKRIQPGKKTAPSVKPPAVPPISTDLDEFDDWDEDLTETAPSELTSEVADAVESVEVAVDTVKEDLQEAAAEISQAVADLEAEEIAPEPSLTVGVVEIIEETESIEAIPVFELKSESSDAEEDWNLDWDAAPQSTPPESAESMSEEDVLESWEETAAEAVIEAVVVEASIETPAANGELTEDAIAPESEVFTWVEPLSEPESLFESPQPDPEQSGSESTAGDTSEEDH